MNLRVRAILTVLLVVSAMLSTCIAYATAPYPGSKLVFEMNLTDKDFLPAVKEMINAMPGLITEAAKSEGKMPPGMDQVLSPDVAKDVATALSGLKSISMSAFEMKNPDAEKLIEFYTVKMGLTKGWSQTLRGGDARGYVALYVKPGLEEMFGLAMYDKGYVVARTSGPIDMALLARTFAKMIPAAIKMAQAGSSTKPIEACRIEETPYGLKGSDSTLGVSWEFHGRGKVTVKSPDGTLINEGTSTTGDEGTPKLIVKTSTMTTEQEGYVTYEVTDENNKTIMIITTEPLPEPAQ